MVLLVLWVAAAVVTTLSAHQLRVDRLLADPTAIRYCAELEQITVPRSPDGRPT